MGTTDTVLASLTQAAQALSNAFAQARDSGDTICAQIILRSAVITASAIEQRINPLDSSPQTGRSETPTGARARAGELAGSDSAPAPTVVPISAGAGVEISSRRRRADEEPTLPIERETLKACAAYHHALLAKQGLVAP